MTTGIARVTWVCIMSATAMGCYTSAVIDMNRVEKYVISPSDFMRAFYDIEYVVLRSGERIRFSQPPVLNKGGIVRSVPGEKKDSIRSKDIDYVITKDGRKSTWSKVKRAYEDTTPFTPTGRVEAKGNSIEYLITRDGTKYVFEGPTAVQNDTVYGVLGAKTERGFADDSTAGSTAARGTQVALPLSEAEQVKVSALDVGSTILGGALGVFALVTLAFALGS